MTDAEPRAAPIRRLAVIGCGPHFLERYSQVIIERSGVLELALIVDLESREREIRAALATLGIRAHRYVFLPERLRNTINLDDARAILNPALDFPRADGVLLCTEPKVHGPYALWALENRLPVFSDKPISAFSTLEERGSLMHDFKELLRASERSGTRYIISCERRVQLGYRFVEEFVDDFIDRYGMPITSIHLHFGGGTWTAAHEMPALENHPYKYGYGTLLHSGYHYIDLIARVAAFNKRVSDIDLARPRVAADAIHPARMFEVAAPDLYSNVLRRARLDRGHARTIPKTLENYGELDLSILGSYASENEHRMNFSAQLLESTASARIIGSQSPKQGRLRQEDVHIHFGNFCSISTHSHSAHKLHAPDSIERFDITIITHPHFARGRPLIRVTREQLSEMHRDLPAHAGLNVFARRSQLRDFLDGGCARSHLRTHAYTVALLSAIYERIASASAEPGIRSA